MRSSATSWITWGVLSAAALLGLSCIGFAWPFDLGINFLFGWALYLHRVVPALSISWPGVGMALVTLCAFTLGLHSLSRQWYGARAAEDGWPRSAWRVKWTLAIVTAVVMLFVAGTGVVGVIHQAVWLATSRERWLASDWEPAGRTSDRNNLHQIGLAAHNYHDGERHFPPGGRMDEHGRPRHGWQTFLLPYIDQTPLFKRIDLQRAWNSAPNAPHFHTRIPVYQNPHIVRNVAAESLVDNAGFSHSHYAANERVLGANSRMEIGDISDGTSNTIMAGDVNGNFRPWGDPVNWRDPAAGINSSASGFGSPFSGGANFLLCDGTVRFISEKVDPAVLKAISTPAGGEPVEGF